MTGSIEVQLSNPFAFATGQYVGDQPTPKPAAELRDGFQNDPGHAIRGRAGDQFDGGFGWVRSPSGRRAPANRRCADVAAGAGRRELLPEIAEDLRAAALSVQRVGDQLSQPLLSAPPPFPRQM